MPAFRFSRRDESQIDPFNAGEPVLPWDDPGALADEGDVFDDRPYEGAGEPGPQAEPVEYAPHGEPGGQPHKREDNYQAPTTRGHDYDAPSIDGPPAGGRRARRARRPAAAEPVSARGASGSRLGKLIAAVVAVLIAVNVAVPVLMLVGEFVGNVSSSFGSAFDAAEDTSYPTSYESDEADEGAMELAASAALSGALADPESGALHDLIAGYLDDKLLSVEGYTAEELGIDADAFAAWAITSTSFSTSGAYDRGDGTAVVYADVVAPSVNDVFWAFDDAIAGYLVEQDLWGVYGGDQATDLTDEQRAHVGDVFAGVLEDAEGIEAFSSIGLLREGDGWVADADGLADAFTSIYGLW